MNELSESTGREMVWSPTVDAWWPFGRWLANGSWDDPWSWLTSTPAHAPRRAGRFPVEVVDGPESSEVRVELPGIPKERISVTLQGTRLRIRAENGTPAAEGGAPAAQGPSRYEAYERTFELVEALPASSISARVQDGVLTVTVPKLKPLPEERIALA